MMIMVKKRNDGKTWRWYLGIAAPQLKPIPILDIFKVLK